MHLGLHLPPHLALYLGIVFILCLFWLDSRRNPPVSRGIWVPTIWLALVGSRPLELWFSQSSASYEGGSPLEALIYSCLIIAGLTILSRRKDRPSLSALISDNGPLFLLLGYYALAIAWSDYPFVSFKRYIKLIGVMVMILVILTDEAPVLALRTTLRRCGYILLPLSIVLAKYFPAGVTYDAWSGEKYVVGVTDTKNMLGQLCLVFGLLFLWEIICRWNARTPGRNRLALAVNALMLFVAIYLLRMSHSDTALVCMAFGAAVLLSSGYESVRRRVGFYVVAGSLVFLFLNWFADIVPAIVHALGRNMTFTGRIYIWEKLLPMAKENLLLGSGYQSFWTPSVLNVMHVNEAHNGYLEIVLNTGLVGLLLFSLFMISTYRRCVELIRSDPQYGRFAMAFFFTAFLYNFTEAAFRGLCIVLFIFLATSVRLPKTAHQRSIYAFASQGF